MKFVVVVLPSEQSLSLYFKFKEPLAVETSIKVSFKLIASEPGNNLLFNLNSSTVLSEPSVPEER